MEALFPLKIDIPDIKEEKLFLHKLFSHEKRLNFLFTREINPKEINIKYENKIYHLGNIIKNDKTISIYYIEIIFDFYGDIEINVLNDSYFIKSDIKGEGSFLFNKYLFDKNNKKVDKLNLFDIYEEFEIYYRIHKEKKNINSLNLLISSTLNYLKAKKEEINFCLFLALFIKEHSYLIKNIYNVEIFLNRKNNGDLSRISNEALYKIIDANKKNKEYKEIYLIYLFLTQKKEIINKFLEDGCLNEQLIFDCLIKYKTIFSNSVNLFPQFIFLIERAKSFNEIKLILKCSKDFVDFIYFLNEGKEFIIKYIDKENILRLGDFLDLRKVFEQKFDEDFYLLLDCIKQFEIKFNKKFFCFSNKLLDYSLKKNTNAGVGFLIFVWMFADGDLDYLVDYFYEYIIKLNKEGYINSLNNFEIIEIIDILSTIKKDKGQIINFFKIIKFENLNEKIKPHFSKIIKNINNDVLKNQDYLKKLINTTKEKANILTRLDTFEYIFICIDKFIETGKKMEDFNIKDDMIDLINNVSNKYLVLLNEIKIENITKEKELYETTSKLIYLNYEYNTEKKFSLSEINQIELLNDIYIHFLNKYKISDLYFDNLISDLIKKGKFGKIYYTMIEEKHFTKFEKLLNKFIIKYEELFIKNHFNFLLIVDLYKKKFFELFKSSSYAKKIIEKLQTIINKINNLNNISLKQLEFLLNEKSLIDFFSTLDKDGFLKNNLAKDLEINISELRSMIEIKNSDEFLLLNDYQRIKFSDQNKIIESIKKFIEEIEQGNTSGIDSLKEKFEKIKYVLKLVKDLQNKISSNYFFKSIKEKNMDISFFEKIIKIFDATKNDEINSDLTPLFDEFLILDSEEKEKIIIDLNDYNNLLNIIYLNSDFENTKEFHKYEYNKINENEMIKINKKIALVIIKYKIKDIYNNYISFQEKLKYKKKSKKKSKKPKNKNSIMQMLDTFLSSLGIKEEIIFKNINNIINEIMNKKFIKILNLLYKNSEAINFLFSITSQDCRNIQELAGEVHGGNNQNFLSIEELLIIEKLVESLEFIRAEMKKGLDEEKKNKDKIIINITQDQFEEEDLEKYLNKYQQYKEFFSENLDKKKFTAEVIQKILNKSEFLIFNGEEQNFEAFYKNEEKEGQDIFKEISYDDLIYLRDRALTRNKINDSLLEKKDEFIQNIKQEEQIILENNKIFVEIVRQINELMKHLNKISQKGFFFCFRENKEKNSSFEMIDKINNILLLKIKIKIKKENDSCNIQFFLNESEYRNFNEINEVVKNIYENICTIQRNSYLKKKYINFIHGKQFNLFLDYFLNKNKNENFNYYLNYFTNKEKYILNDFVYQNSELNIKNENFYKNFIDQCEFFLDKIFKDNGLTLENIYQQNRIKEGFKDFRGIFLNGSEKLENEIICLYKYFTNNIPLASTLLFCKKDTSIEEITSFIIRAILCEYPIFFCLAKTDILSEEKKNYIFETIIDLIGRIKDENKFFKMNSCLIIMNNNLEDDLCKSLFKLKYIKTLDIPQEKKNKIKLFEENDNYEITVVSSDYSGIGKSTYIKNKVKEENYIYFPIGGIFNKENTLKRLQNLNREKNINDADKKLLMHVDLYDTDQISLMNDFLYFVLFTKLYGQDNNIFYLSKKIRIYLEIPNSFINFFDKYPILSIFPNKKLYRDSLEKLLVPKDICSHIKIVSLYLKLLKEENTLPENTSRGFKADNKIDKNEIVFPFTPPDIILKDENNYDYNKIVIKAENENKYLTSELCQKLILEELNKTIKKPTYYQITTFINVLASQLIQFNRNYFLSACSILDSGRFYNCCVRSLIVKKFIELTSYFTKGAFTELLNEQEIVQTLMKSKGKEKEKIERANKLLEECKHDSISFNNMNNLALVFFHGGDNSNFFSIITNKKTNEQTYIDLLNLKNFQSGKDIINQIKIKNKDKLKLDCITNLNDYNKFTQKDFLEELKSILDIKNPIEKNKDNDEMISLSEITKDYVFTEDNFIKMCLILIRLRADIPVIMMGETGCGKTSLIRKLSEMQNNGKCLLVIDNIHAGHTNEDIINFIESKVIPDAKALAEKEKIIKEKYSKFGQIYEEKKL